MENPIAFVQLPFHVKGSYFPPSSLHPAFFLLTPSSPPSQHKSTATGSTPRGSPSRSAGPLLRKRNLDLSRERVPWTLSSEISTDHTLIVTNNLRFCVCKAGRAGCLSGGQQCGTRLGEGLRMFVARHSCSEANKPLRPPYSTIQESRARCPQVRPNGFRGVDQAAKMVGESRERKRPRASCFLPQRSKEKTEIVKEQHGTLSQPHLQLTFVCVLLLPPIPQRPPHHLLQPPLLLRSHLGDGPCFEIRLLLEAPTFLG